jgi:hypothetical protein
LSPRRIISRDVEQYDIVQLHSAIGHVAPADKLAGREAESSPPAIASWPRCANVG